MKLSKIFAISLLGATLTACSDYDASKGVNSPKINSAAGVTVSMQDNVLDFPEDQISDGTYYNIPIVVTGEPNGAVRVTVNITAAPQNGAKEGENFIVTSKTVNISADSKVANIQFYPKGDRIINEDREFTVTIADAKGAAIGTQSSTQVYLLDNDYIISQLYPTIDGIWNWAYSGDDEGETPVVVQTYAEGTPEYDNRELDVIGFMGEDECVFRMTFDYNAVTEQAILSMPYGQYVLSSTFNTSTGPMDLSAYTSVWTTNDEGEITGVDYAGSNEAYSNRELTRFTFSRNIDLLLSPMGQGASKYQFLWMQLDENVLSR